jgi:hypothetical protein
VGTSAAAALAAISGLVGLVAAPVAAASGGALNARGVDGQITFAPSASPTTSIVRPAQTVTYPNLKLLLGDELVINANVDDLTVDATDVRPGQTIRFTGRGFLRNANVDVLLARADTSAARISKEIHADANGRIDDTIQVPASAVGGPWVLAAIDASRVYYQLRALVDGQTSTLTAQIDAADIRVAGAPQCASRPNIRLTTAPAGPGALQVSLTASPSDGVPTNTLASVTFDGTASGGAISTNATIDIGNRQGVTGHYTYTPPEGTTTMTFVVHRVAPGGAVTVPVTIADACGEWKTFVGGGPSAF